MIPLSRIPMAALYDGNGFLIEKYAVPVSLAYNYYKYPNQ